MSRSEVDLYCQICQDVFSDPVLLACSHSFCSACVQTWWQDKAIRLCPLCMQKSPPGEPPRNLALRNLCEAFLLERRGRGRCDAGGRCRLHAERLRLFCVDHREPACLVCRDSEVHAGHRFQTVDEAAQERRKGLRLSVQPLRDQLKLFKETRGDWRDAGEYIRTQAGLTEAHIREHFKKLRQFLQGEEEARVAALREEEEQTSRKLKEAIEEMSASIDALSETIGVADEQLRANDISFLQSLADTEVIVQEFPPLDDPPPARGALINMAKHLGNLSFTVWSKMKEVVSYSPVVLDPNSAHPELVFSEDLSNVRCSERQELPANPERFQVCRSVLGSEGFDSGVHSWEVEVGENPVWAVGVASESVDRKHAIETGLWSIMFNEGQYTAFSPGPDVHLPLTQNPRRVRVELNWSRGRLTFTDPDSNTHIHTFRHTFTERLFPILRTNNHLPLSIVAEKDPPGSKANSWWSLFR